MEAAARAGRPETSHAALEAFAGWAQASGSDWTRSALERMRGLLATGDDAAAHFEASLEAIGDRFPFDGARTRLVYGEWLRRARRRADAREHLRAAQRSSRRSARSPGPIARGSSCARRARRGRGARAARSTS